MPIRNTSGTSSEGSPACSMVLTSGDPSLLKPEHVDIWTIPFQRHSPLSTALTYLTPLERTRCLRFHHHEHQYAFAYTRMAVKRILAPYLSIAPPDLDFNIAQHGKPYLKHATPIQFNWSHTANYALLAVGHTSPLGIDIEAMKIRPFHGIATHVFSTQEQRYLHTLPAALLPFGFFTIWSSKEAFIKALGIGLKYPLSRLDIPPISPSQLNTAYTVKDPLTQHHWKLHTFLPVPGVMAAVCTSPTVQTLDHHVYHPDTCC